MKRKYPIIDVVKTGKNIKHIMKSRGYTVKDVQRFLGLGTPQGIYHWFDGRCLPTIDNLYALSELFHMPIDEMVCGNRRYNITPLSKESYRRIFLYYEKLRDIAG